MKARLLKYWDRLRSSFWFLPSFMALSAAVLAYGTVALDKAVTDEWLRNQAWAYAGGAQGAPEFTFSGVVDAAFNQIRQCAGSSAAVSIRLLETIAVIATAVRRPEDRIVLWRHAEMIARGARGKLPESEDRRAVEERLDAAIRALRETGESESRRARCARPC